MDKEIWDLVDTNCWLSPNSSNLQEFTEKPLVLLACYGSMLHPLGAFLMRTSLQYRKICHLDRLTIDQDIRKYHLGVFQIFNRKLNFNKRNTNQFGFASISLADNDGDYVLASVYAVPKTLLAPSGSLMMAEGCSNWDFYNPENHYCLLPNVNFPLVNTDPNTPKKEKVLSTFSTYIFLPGKTWITPGLSPEEKYRNDIVSQLETLKSEGFNVSENYIDLIKAF